MIAFFLLFVKVPAFADNDETLAYKNESLELKTFDKSQWRSLSENMSFTQKVKPKKIKKDKGQNSSNNTIVPPEINPVSFMTFARFVLVFLAVLLLAYVIFKTVAGDAILVNNQVQRKNISSIRDVETNLQEADVDGFLQKSLTDEDYRLSIRLYYLSIIKELSLKNVINWKKDKTNGHYLREMRDGKHPLLKEFRNVTRIFEYVWYSNTAFDKGQFLEVSVDFKNLLTAIK